MAKNNGGEGDDTLEVSDAPLIDLNDATIKKLVARAKKRGYITVRSAQRSAAAGPDVVRPDRGHQCRR